MRLALACALALVAIGPRSAAADLACDVFGDCVYEGPAFRFTVVDAETREPLAGVHALAEWVQYGFHGRNGPVMVQDATSGPDGVLAFPAWGPVPGSAGGLAIDNDPVISLLKPGYHVAIVPNGRGPQGRDRDLRARQRWATQDGKTIPLQRFQGTSEEWVQALRKVRSGLAFPRSDEQSLQFRGPYLNRLRLVWAERDKVPSRYQERGQFFWFVEFQMKSLEEGKR